MDTTMKTKTREGAGLWLIKVIGGFLIVFLLGLHFIINHLVAPNGLLSWEDVVRYYQNPIIPAIEVVFLVVVVAHSLIGTRGILLDMKPSGKVLRALDALFWVVGVVAVVYGIWLVMVVVNFGRAG
jgi:succinate dehydrogenase / fumarate reductase membrane anchor subunit